MLHMLSTRAERVAIITALEAIEIGDYRYAGEILLEALETGPSERPYPCRNGCGAMHEWPGIRDAHEMFCTTTHAGDLSHAA